MLALCILIAFLLGCGLIRIPTGEPLRGNEAQVIRIVDGDTIEVFLRGNSETVRYIGIDTPERGQPGYRAAKEANRALVGGKRVRLQQDTTDRDVFGRLLRYVFLEDGTLVNAKLVQAGMAQPVEYRPDTARAEEFRQLALEAARAKAGFWSGTSDVDGAMSYGLTTREADIRRGPGSSYDLTARIPADTLLTIFGRSPNSRWLQIRTPDRKGGWVSKNAVEANVPLATIPLGEVDGVMLTGGTPVANSTATPAAKGAKCPDGCLTPPEAVCNIKGNVNSSGDRIYHLPSGSLYQRTHVNTDEGDRWFCTVKEAEGAGFRAALR
jgi:endonuclease YncB( thermonuclease family)